MKNYAVLLILLLLCGTLPAQEPQTATTNVPQQTVAVNLLALPFGTATAEYEHVLFSPKTSLGVSGWYEYDNVVARWAYLKAMYYPGGTALKGLGIGITAGVIRYYRDDDKPDQLAKDTSPMAGVMVQYNWLPGARDKYLIGVGIGGRAALKDLADNSPLKRFDGDARIVCGIAF